MRKILSLALGLTALLMCVPQADAARKRTRSSEEKPIITIRSDAFNVVGPTNSFGIILGSTETDYFDIDAGFGLQEMEVEPWQISDGAITGTYKTITVSEEGEIRIYGDPLKIDMIQLQGGYVTEIDMEQCLNLEVLDLSHNSLQKLDLTPFTNLYAIYLSDNPFTKETPLKLGAPKNSLAILEIDIVDHLDQSFNLSDYPSMQAFDAYHNLDLWKIDPTGCPQLMTMSLEMTNVSSLDVSKNPHLLSLNISETRITDIDLSNNPNITTFMAEHASGSFNTAYHLNDIDLSKLPELSILYLGGNRLEEVDLSHNSKLFTLNLKKNRLKSLDLSGNPNLYSITIMNNDMDFASLPAPQETWGEYFYLQNDIPVSKSMKAGEVLDLSARVLRPGTETTVTVWKQSIDGTETVIDPSIYTYSDGKVTFHEAVADSLYIKYHNSLFPEYPLSTSLFMVKTSEEYGAPSPAATITPAGSTLSASIGMAGATADMPVKFLVDFGNGDIREFNADAQGLDGEPNLSVEVTPGNALTIYAPEGKTLTALGIVGSRIANIDLRMAHELRELKINNAGLTDIDLRYNHCLESLDLDGNELTALDLQGLNPRWEKWMLTDLSAKDNSIAEINVVATTVINRMDLSGNRLAEISLKNYDNLKTLDLSDNDLAGEISLTYLMDADTIILSGNRLNRIVHDTFNSLSLLDIHDNLFDIETLPYQPGATEYIYAPQKPMELLPTAPAVNLTSQNRVLADGTGTTFTWKKDDGSLLVEGSDMICVDGATRFLKDDLGMVYCELTNPAFPALTGADVLRTTEVKVVGAPTKVAATFTTREDSEAGELIIAADVNTSIYVDWRGDGSEFIPYSAYRDADYNAYDAIRTYKDAKVTVYTYDDPTNLKVFSVYGIKMSEFDGTPMTGLRMIGVSEADLDLEDIKLPDAPLTDLNLIDNRLSEFIWADKYPDLQSLNLSGNRFESFDASPFKDLRTLYLSRNSLSDVKFDNPLLWEIDLQANALKSIDLSGLKVLDQLWISENELSEIDLRPFRASLHALSLARNRFTFKTLPVQSDYPHLSLYNYSDQAEVEAVVSEDGMTYDLSSQAIVKDIYQTSYIWMLGEPVFDSETGELSGEILYVDDEYTISGGITHFNTTFSDDVVCVMLNDLFPKTYLQTPPYRVGTSAVEAVTTETEAAVDVYTLSGSIVKRNAERRDALEGLPEGIYIVGGRKVFVR